MAFAYIIIVCKIFSLLLDRSMCILVRMGHRFQINIFHFCKDIAILILGKCPVPSIAIAFWYVHIVSKQIKKNTNIS